MRNGLYPSRRFHKTVSATYGTPSPSLCNNGHMLHHHMSAQAYVIETTSNKPEHSDIARQSAHLPCLRPLSCAGQQ